MWTHSSSGTLRQRLGGAKTRRLSYKLTCLSERHLPQIMELQEVIVQHLPSKELLKTFSYDFMKQHLGDRGFILGVLVQGRLVAFRNVYFPAPTEKEWNLGIDVGLSEEELPHVANLQMVCVHPDFRGNGIALKMNKAALEILREIKTYYHICATVSPDNIWNIPVLLASGFSITKVKTKYGGKIRYIAYQDLRKPLSFRASDFKLVKLDDLSTQKKLMDMGFYGTHIIKRQRAGQHGDSDSIDILFRAVEGAPRESGSLNMPSPWPALSKNGPVQHRGIFVWKDAPRL